MKYIITALFLISSTSWANTFSGCSTAKVEVIKSDLKEGRRLLAKAIRFLEKSKGNEIELKRYFGGLEQKELEADTMSLLRQNFYILEDAAREDGYRYYCTKDQNNELAKDNAGFFRRMWLREKHFTKDPSERVITMIHEWSHEFLWTRDLGYYENALKLSSLKQLVNAESYGLFAGEFK
jgi:hypothetical protein